MPIIFGNGVALKLETEWKNSHKFIPERWDNISDSKTKNTIFGGAIKTKRICPGYKFFRLETLLFVCLLLSKYKFNIKHNDELYSIKSVYGLVTGANIPIYINVSKR